MGDATIKVRAEVRDRLALLARQRGITIGELVTQFAGGELTDEERAARARAAAEYVHEHLCPDQTPDQLLAGGDAVWRRLEAGATTL